MDYLDAYVQTQGLESRSAALQKAVRLLRASELGAAYEDAWTDWANSEDAELWDARGDRSPVTLRDGVVVLRPWELADARFMTDASRDPAIERYNGPPPSSVEDAISVIEHIERSWRVFEAQGDATGVAFAIVDATSGEPVGMCGVDDWSETHVAQFGYWLAADARGRGLATRAVKLMTGWLLFGLGAARVFMTIQCENAASAAVARRAGFTYEGTLRSDVVREGRRHDVDVFATTPGDWIEKWGP